MNRASQRGPCSQRRSRQPRAARRLRLLRMGESLDLVDRGGAPRLGVHREGRIVEAVDRIRSTGPEGEVEDVTHVAAMATTASARSAAAQRSSLDQRGARRRRAPAARQRPPRHATNRSGVTQIVSRRLRGIIAPPTGVWRHPRPLHRRAVAVAGWESRPRRPGSRRARGGRRRRLHAGRARAGRGAGRYATR